MRTAEQVPGVVAAEPWTFAEAQRVRDDDATGANLIVFGLPDGARTVRPVLEEGRFLVPGDGNALVVTRNFLDDEPDVRHRRPGHAALQGPRGAVHARRASSSRPPSGRSSTRRPRRSTR